MSIDINTSFVMALTVVFVVLKIMNVIAWSWWWVLSPLWISAVVVLVIGVIALVSIWVEDKR